MLKKLLTILLFITVTTAVYAYSKMTEGDVEYFNALKNCKEGQFNSYAGDDGGMRYVYGAQNGYCVFREVMGTSIPNGIPGMVLACKMPQSEVRKMVDEALSVYHSGKEPSEDFQKKYLQYIMNYCEVSLGEQN